MPNMSFFLTTTAMRNRTKTHTIRLGWRKAKPGDVIRAVVKGRGLRPGQHVEPLSTIQVDTAAFRPINSITREEVIREGFPDKTPEQFVAWFTIRNKCQPTLCVTFIGFHFLD